MDKQVILYTSPTCGYCGMVKSFFEENNVKYEEYDVSVDEKKSSEMVEKSGQMGVPVVTVGEEVVIGFDKNKLVELLGLS